MKRIIILTLYLWPTNSITMQRTSSFIDLSDSPTQERAYMHDTLYTRIQDQEHRYHQLTSHIDWEQWRHKVVKKYTVPCCVALCSIALIAAKIYMFTC